MLECAGAPPSPAGGLVTIGILFVRPDTQSGFGFFIFKNYKITIIIINVIE